MHDVHGTHCAFQAVQEALVMLTFKCTGDVVTFLWWRLLHGEMPKLNQPKAVVLLIGTNDLTYDDCLATELGTIAAVPGIVSRYTLIYAVLLCSCVSF